MSIIYVKTDDNRLQPTIPQKDSAESNMQFISAYLADWESSKQRTFMDVCERYYNNESDILEKRRTVISKDEENNPVLAESKLLANNKLTHNFLQKLIKQKLGYTISKPFTIDPDDSEDETAKAMIKDIKEYYTKSFHRMIKNAAKDSLVNGLGWVQVYYNEQGKLSFKRIPSKEIAPIWKDIDHTELAGVIRKYTVNDFSTGKKIENRYIEYYTEDKVYYYKYNADDVLIPNTSIFVDAVGPHYFGMSVDKNQAEGKSWGRVPFIAFKYNSEETPLLSKIKTLIDDYDKKTSSISDLIDDIPNSITIVKNYDGSSKEEFVKNKNEYRTIFVQGDGDAKALETPLNINELDVHIQRLREDIYEFGQGVNTADKDIRDTSGVALRFLYADLDMDCNDWGPELETSIIDILTFIIEDIKNTRGTDYTSVNYSILFNTDVIINETETITNCFTSKGVISDETIAANHPWTRDVDKEMENMYKDDVQELELENNYGQTPSNTIDGQIRKSGQE